MVLVRSKRNADHSDIFASSSAISTSHEGRLPSPQRGRGPNPKSVSRDESSRHYILQFSKEKAEHTLHLSAPSRFWNADRGLECFRENKSSTNAAVKSAAAGLPLHSASALLVQW